MSNKTTGIMKVLKCFCNDEEMCPRVGSSYGQELEERFCTTNTVCLTKRIKRKDATTWLKYSCEQTFLDGIRENVIEYRDCKVNKYYHIRIYGNAFKRISKLHFLFFILQSHLDFTDFERKCGF